MKTKLHQLLTAFFLLFVFYASYGQILTEHYTHNGTYSDTIYITENILIPPGDSLVVSAGTLVLFSAHFNIDVRGTLIARGTEEKPIGFTIADTTGFSNQTNERGSWGGIEFTQISPESDSSLFTHCHFKYSKAIGDTVSKFGGVFNIRDFNKIRIQNCNFQHNFAWHWGGAIYGKNANVAIKNSKFEHNVCGQISPPFGYGGAICFVQALPVVLNCSFTDNRSTGIGGGAAFEYADVHLGANLFLNNHSGLGGALGYLRSEPKKPVVNNVFVGNSSVFFGEAIACIRSNPTFIHNSLVDNCKDSYGGVFYCNDSATPVIINSILYNTAVANNFEVYLWDNLSTPHFINCNVRGGKEAFGGTGGADFNAPYTDNIDLEPQLVHTGEYYCLLRENSPCIDAGTTQVDIPYYPDFDFRGFSRISGTTPDIGAYEYKSDLGFNNPEYRNKLFCYPNPFDSYLKVTLPETDKETSLMIYDVYGRLVFTKKLPANLLSYTWDGRDKNGLTTKEGIYIVKCYSMEHKSAAIILRGF